MSTEHNKLIRGLSLIDATSVVIGTVIGTGIFIVPAYMTRTVLSPFWVFMVWIVAGLLSLAGALTYAELGAAFPKAGGEYVYIREAYGPLFGFLYGWTEFLVAKTGSLATLASGFALYLNFFIPLQRTFYRYDYNFFGTPAALLLDEKVIVAIAMIWLMSFINVFGVVTSGRLQSLMTALKVGVIVLLVALGFTLGEGSFSHFTQSLAPAAHFSLLGAFGVAAVRALWAYDGWNNCNMVAGEIKNPARNIPRALIFGTAGIILLYLIANAVYFYILPIDKLSSTDTLAADVARTFLGAWGGKFAAAAVLISIIAALNGSVLSGSRIYYAMAEDRLFFKKIADVHPRYRTPVFSIFIQAIWASLLCLTGTYDQLLTYVIFASWILYALGTGSVFILRRKYPNVERPYKVWGYPLLPAVFVLLALLLLINTLAREPKESGMGLCIVLLGLPAYGYWKRKRAATR